MASELHGKFLRTNSDVLINSHGGVSHQPMHDLAHGSGSVALSVETRLALTMSSTLGVLELGTNSLKLHVYRPGEDRFASYKHEWEAGFEIYSSGSVSDGTIEAILLDVRELLDDLSFNPEDLFGVATGAFVEAENSAQLLKRIDRELSIPVRVLTGNEEANLLIHGFGDLVKRRPLVILDLGGGRLKKVMVGESLNFDESLDLGIIKVQQVGSFDASDWQEETAARYIREQLKSSRPGPFSPDVYATGGAVKAISQVAGTTTITRKVLNEVESVARENRFPESLSERRRRVFLAGLLVVRHVLDHVGGERIHYHHFRLGDTLMLHLRPFYKTFGGKLRRAFIDREFELFS